MDLKDTYKLLSQQDMTEEEWINASILVATNRERLTLIEEKAKQYARHNKTHLICWPREFKNWEQQPIAAHQNEAMNDPIFWQHYVAEADGFLNESVAKGPQFVNALPIKCNSIKYDRDHEQLLHHMMETHDYGDPIRMPVPPQCVILQVFPPELMDPQVRAALHELSLERPVLGRTRGQSQSLPTNRILIPFHRHQCSWDQNPSVIRGGSCFLPSRALFRDIFPMELAFSITVHKAQGKTLRRIIIALSSCGVGNCRFTFSQLLVALSRVQQADHIRLLLTGMTEEEQWESVAFVNRLKRDPSIAYYFAGFRPLDHAEGSDINIGWMDDTWCQKRANRVFEEMIDSGLFQ